MCIYYIILYCIVLYYTVLYYIILYYIIYIMYIIYIYYIILYYIISYHIILYYIILYLYICSHPWIYQKSTSTDMCEEKLCFQSVQKRSGQWTLQHSLKQKKVVVEGKRGATFLQNKCVEICNIPFNEIWPSSQCFFCMISFKQRTDVIRYFFKTK